MSNDNQIITDKQDDAAKKVKQKKLKDKRAKLMKRNTTNESIAPVEGSSSPESLIKQKSASAYMDNYNASENESKQVFHKYASDIVTDEIHYEDNDQDRFNSNSNGFGAPAEDR